MPSRLAACVSIRDTVTLVPERAAVRPPYLLPPVVLATVPVGDYFVRFEVKGGVHRADPDGECVHIPAETRPTASRLEDHSAVVPIQYSGIGPVGEYLCPCARAGLRTETATTRRARSPPLSSPRVPALPLPLHHRPTMRTGGLVDQTALKSIAAVSHIEIDRKLQGDCEVVAGIRGTPVGRVFQLRNRVETCTPDIRC